MATARLCAEVFSRGLLVRLARGRRVYTGGTGGRLLNWVVLFGDVFVSSLSLSRFELVRSAPLAVVRGKLLQRLWGQVKLLQDFFIWSLSRFF